MLRNETAVRPCFPMTFPRFAGATFSSKLEFPFWPFIGSEYTPIRLPANPSIFCFVPGLSQRLPSALSVVLKTRYHGFWQCFFRYRCVTGVAGDRFLGCRRSNFHDYWCHARPRRPCRPATVCIHQGLHRAATQWRSQPSHQARPLRFPAQEEVSQPGWVESRSGAHRALRSRVPGTPHYVDRR